MERVGQWRKRKGGGRRLNPSHLVELVVDLSPRFIRGDNIHNLANDRLAEHALLARAQRQVSAHVLGGLLGDDRVDQLVNILIHDGVALGLNDPNRPNLLVDCRNGLCA
jgi:hypothetical protein